MLCNGNNPIMQVIGAERLNWKSGFFEVNAREYSALTFRIRGSAAILGGEKEHKIRAGDVLYLPQGMSYRAEYTDTEVIAIHFVTQRADEEIEVFSLQNVERIYKLFMQAGTLWEKKSPGYSVHLMARLYTILGTLLEEGSEAPMPQHFLDAVAFINSSFKNSALSIDLICSSAGISATVLRTLFRAFYQKTPMEYITELRLEHARSLISGGVGIERAALESGFNDSKYFARVVKKHFDCTPRSFKQYGK
ncbi:MAG: helix-turn-helix domain-containing protein [Clostridia bacterium]|nr:helix-turn-helix domain-containing protein [Clostridia bacterium]